MIFGYLCLALILVLFVLDLKRIILLVEEYKKQIKAFLKRIWAFIKDWRNFIAFGIAWMITNGWSYVFIILGEALSIKWMLITGSAYLAFLWLPVTPEKLVTIPLAALIKKLIFRRKNERV